MNFNDMLSAPLETLQEHYASCRELAYNAARIAQSCSPRSRKRLANQTGYLMRQIEMCEAAARRRRLPLG